MNVDNILHHLVTKCVRHALKNKQIVSSGQEIWMTSEGTDLILQVNEPVPPDGGVLALAFKRAYTLKKLNINFNQIRRLILPGSETYRSSICEWLGDYYLIDLKYPIGLTRGRPDETITVTLMNQNKLAFYDGYHAPLEIVDVVINPSPSDIVSRIIREAPSWKS